MEEEPLVDPPRRVGLVVALVATLIAVPLLVLTRSSGGGDDADTSPTSRPRETVVVAVDRPAIGPPKGISVVTSSTTSSTLPLTTTTTMPPPPFVPPSQPTSAPPAPPDAPAEP